jgi:hypothetical protein
LDVSKACGFDNILVIKFRNCARPPFLNLTISFTRLINTSLSLGQYTTCWKMANVIPLYLRKIIASLGAIIVQYHYSLVYPTFVKKLGLLDFIVFLIIKVIFIVFNPGFDQVNPRLCN